MAAYHYNTGYEDERFKQLVSQNLHCIICTNVLKDPVMCSRNEHLFCRACITIHLANFQTCPTCMEPLNVNTLGQPSRTVRNLLSELIICCDYFDRGCVQFVELEGLERHVAECGFAPAFCPNEGCQLEMNKRDLLHHETTTCELRRVQCHSCNEINAQISTLKVSLVAMNEKMDQYEKKYSEKLDKSEAKFTAVFGNVIAKVEQVQAQLNQQEISGRYVGDDIIDMRKSLSDLATLLERTRRGSSPKVCVKQQQEQKVIVEGGGIEREPKVVVAGGGNLRNLNSVEMFCLSSRRWTPLSPMKECRRGASSVVYYDTFCVLGGYLKSMERLSLNAVRGNQAMNWEVGESELLQKLSGHCSVVYEGRVFVIGGFDADKKEYSDSITEPVPLGLSQTRTATMPQKRCRHGVAMFGDKVVILGGRTSLSRDSSLRSVIMYSITENECFELAPLPYPVCEMATVKWGDDNVIIIGGRNNDETLNSVLIYNVKTQKSHALPDMKYKRKGCVAAAVKGTVIVMGGEDEKENYLKTVECFRFDSYCWDDLPEMAEARAWATVAVC